MSRSRQRKLSKNEHVRRRECTVVSVLVSNHLHDQRLLDPTALADQIGPLNIDATLDGDIPVHIKLRKASYGPAWIEWKLWPDDSGRPTWGTMTVFRTSTGKASLDVLSYDRSRMRSSALAQIVTPYAKWGLRSDDFAELGITSTY